MPARRIPTCRMPDRRIPDRRMPAWAPRLLLALLPLLGSQRPASASASPSALCQAAIARAEREAGIPPRLLAALGRVESGRRDPESGQTAPWPWTIHAEGQGSFFPDRAAAIAAVRALQAQGVRSIDVGCMQINLRHHPGAFASLEEAFDPLANARYAARFLTGLQATRGDWMRSAGHYHSQTPDHAEAYRARVAAAWEAERAAPAPGPAQRGFAPAPTGAAMLETPLSRGGAILPLAGGTGRGLDAYRAQPIAVSGRVTSPLALAAAPPALRPAPAMPLSLAAMAGARPAAAGQAAPAAPAGMPMLAAPGLGLAAPAGGAAMRPALAEAPLAARGAAMPAAAAAPPGPGVPARPTGAALPGRGGAPWLPGRGLAPWLAGRGPMPPAALPTFAAPPAPGPLVALGPRRS